LNQVEDYSILPSVSPAKEPVEPRGSATKKLGKYSESIGKETFQTHSSRRELNEKSSTLILKSAQPTLEVFERTEMLLHSQNFIEHVANELGLYPMEEETSLMV
jgi:hypothetical protein